MTLVTTVTKLKGKRYIIIVIAHTEQDQTVKLT